MQRSNLQSLGEEVKERAGAVEIERKRDNEMERYWGGGPSCRSRERNGK